MLFLHQSYSQRCGVCLEAESDPVSMAVRPPGWDWDDDGVSYYVICPTCQLRTTGVIGRNGGTP